MYNDSVLPKTNTKQHTLLGTPVLCFPKIFIQIHYVFIRTIILNPVIYSFLSLIIQDKCSMSIVLCRQSSFCLIHTCVGRMVYLIMCQTMWVTTLRKTKSKNIWSSHLTSCKGALLSPLHSSVFNHMTSCAYIYLYLQYKTSLITQCTVYSIY